MANLSADPKSGVYRIRFRFNGLYANRSLKTKSISVARSIESRINETIRLIDQGRLEIPPKVDPIAFILADGKLRPAAQNTKPVSIRQLLKAYQNRLPSQAKEPNTVSLESTHIKHFLRLLPANKVAGAISSADLQRYVERRLSEERNGRFTSPETVKREIGTFRGIWKWAKNEYVEDDCPSAGIIQGKADAKPPFMLRSEIEHRISRGGLSEIQVKDLWSSLYLTLGETKDFLSHAKAVNRHPFVYPMLVFVANTGVRRSEMIRVQIDDVDFETRSVIVREKKRSKTKATTFRRVDMNSLLCDVMRDWFQNHPGGQYAFCMPPEAGNVAEQLTRDQARDQFEQTFANSSWDVVRGFHVLRHSFASNLASSGVDQRVIDLWMGHQTEEMRLRYRHLLPSVRSESIEMLVNGD